MQVTPYLDFNGRTEEALEFYKAKLNAEIGMVMRFKDLPPGQPTMGSPPPGKIMHSRFKVGDTALFASDGRCAGQPDFKGVSMSLGASTDAEAERMFAALSEGGQVHMAMTETFFATRFGMVVDKFGLMWMVIVERNRGAS